MITAISDNEREFPAGEGTRVIIQYTDKSESEKDEWLKLLEADPRKFLVILQWMHATVGHICKVPILHKEDGGRHFGTENFKHWLEHDLVLT